MGEEQRVGIGNRPIEGKSNLNPGGTATARDTLTTLMMLGSDFRYSVAEASVGISLTAEQRLVFQRTLEQANQPERASTDTEFHRGLPLKEQDEILNANDGLIGVHMAEYVVLRQGGLDHKTSLVLARLAALIEFGDHTSRPEQQTSQPTSD